MSDEGREELTRGEDFASFERRMMNLFDRMAERIGAEAEASRSRDEAVAEESRRRDEEWRHWKEEAQRRTEFLVQQQIEFQAKSATDMQELLESQKRGERKWEKTAEGINALLAIAEIHQQEINELRQAQARTDAQMSETDRRMAETDERLNALINTVERIISERRNGGRKAAEGENE